MYKVRLTFSALALMFTLGAEAQTPATELVKNNPIVLLERGQSVDVYGEYSLVGGTFGYNVNGAAMLFYNSQYIREYRVSNTSDGVGRRGTIGIDQHAVVVAAPDFQEGGYTKGKISIFKKTWDGTHYSPTVSQSFAESAPGTGYGQAVSISDNWIVVGAPARNTDGGVTLYYRNQSTGNWEDRGWLPLPSFENAPFRYRSYGGPLIKQAASFGASLQIHHNNMIIGAPGIGSFYIFEFDGTSWIYKAEYKGTKNLGQTVAISDEYAASSTSGLETETFKKTYSGTNLWPSLQTITTERPATSIATDGSRLVLGQPSGGTDNKGIVTYYEIRGHQVAGTNTWVSDFVKIGKMFVSVAASKFGMKDYRLLGHSVAIYQNTVVAGAPNTQYAGFADGAGFKGDFYQYTSARMSEEEEEPILAGLTLYPNPASSTISISANSAIVNATAVNVLGEKASLDFVGSQINTSKLAKGTYFFSVETEAGKISQQVVIQ